MYLPKAFEERMKRLLKDEYNEYIQCYSRPNFGGLRVNTLKLSPEEFERICPFSIRRIPWLHNGYYYDLDIQPAKHPYYHAGLYYIQEPSAMTPASLLPINSGDKVLDICAAPGGKSTELGARLAGTGLLVSNDISNSRAKALLKNIELFGISNSLVLSEDPNKLKDYFPGFFDKILIDAPCSGEGMFRKSPAIMKNWEQYGVDYYNRLQKDIIIAAASMLKPGGYMLYSTCTFSPEENEGTISYLLDNCPDFSVVNALPDEETRKQLGISYDGFDNGRPDWVNGRDELKNCIRLWPHKLDGEGHFIALLHRADNLSMSISDPVAGFQKTNTSSNISEEAIAFINEVKFINDKSRLIALKDWVYLTPEGLPDIKGLRILRQGLLLGEMKKQRFEPSQDLACALKTDYYNKSINLSSNDTDVLRYLKCETIAPEGKPDDGWNLVCVDGYPLGWAKISNGNFKNKYLAGWRLF